MDLHLLRKGERFDYVFGRQTTSEKGMTKTFSSKKLTSKQCVVYFEVKVQQNRCALCI